MRRGERRDSGAHRDDDIANSPDTRSRQPSMLTVRLLVLLVVCLFAMLVVMGQMLLRDPPASTLPVTNIVERRNLAKGAVGLMALRHGKQQPSLGQPKAMNLTLSELKTLKEEERLSWLHQIREGILTLGVLEYFTSCRSSGFGGCF